MEDFYENYSKKKETNIRDNKCSLFLSFFLGSEADDHPANSETQKRSTLASFLPPFRRGLQGSVSAASLTFRTHRARQLHGQVLVQLIWQDLMSFAEIEERGRCCSWCRWLLSSRLALVESSFPLVSSCWILYPENCYPAAHTSLSSLTGYLLNLLICTIVDVVP